MVFLGVFGLLFLKVKREDLIWDMPFRDEKERPPGESLRIKIDDLHTDLVSSFFPMVIGASLPLGLQLKSIPLYWKFIVVIVALIWMWWSVRSILKIYPLIRSYNIGFQGERLTAQYLQPLLCKGYHVFHDIPMNDYNVDHVVVGPNGVFAVETKTRRKRISAGIDRAKVLYDGQALHYPECQPEKYGLEAAVSRAKGLQDWISSAVGESITVKPILALPGWYVDRKGSGNLPVMNPKSIPNFVVKSDREKLSDNQIKRIKHQLFEKSKVIP